MHISLPRTLVIYNKMCTSLPRPYPSIRPAADSPLVHTAAAPDPTDVAAARTDAAAGKTGTPTEYPAAAHPTSTTCGQPPHRHHTKRRGAIYDARRPAGRNHRRMTTRPRRPAQHPRRHAQHPRRPMRPTSCRLRAATGVINGAPTTRKRQDNPTGRNHRRTQHAPLRHANDKTGCGPTVPTEKLAFPCPGSRLCVSLHQANGKMPAAVP